MRPEEFFQLRRDFIETTSATASQTVRRSLEICRLGGELKELIDKE
jgi:hypothetical protein